MSTATPPVMETVEWPYMAAARAPTTNNELTAKIAQDSMSMVEIVLYNPLIPIRDPVTVRMFLPCRMSRMTIIRVRRTLSETEIEMYGIPKLGNPGRVQVTPSLYWKYSVTIPIPTLMGLVWGIVAGLWKGGMRTKGGKVHEAGKGDGPELCGVYNVATVDLGAEQTLDTRASEWDIKK